MLASIPLLDSSSVNGEAATGELFTPSRSMLAPWTPRGLERAFFLFLTTTWAQSSRLVAESLRYLAISIPARNREIGRASCRERDYIGDWSSDVCSSDLIPLLDSSSVNGEAATGELFTPSRSMLAPWTPRGLERAFFLFLTTTWAQSSRLVAESLRYLAISIPARNR